MSQWRIPKELHTGITTCDVWHTPYENEHAVKSSDQLMSWNTISFQLKHNAKFIDTQFSLHMESYLGQFWLLASSFQH